MTRRKPVWQGQVFELTSLTAGQQAVINMGSLLPDIVENPIGRQGLTIMRTFVSLRIASTDAEFSAECAFGIIMVDGDAFVSSALPDPVLDVTAPWMYWDRRVCLPSSDSGQHLSLDVKARRVFKGNDDTPAFIIDNDDAVQTLEFSFSFRMLLLKP